MQTVPASMLTKFRKYVDGFCREDNECYRQCIPNADAERFLAGQIPFLECPDEEIEKTYYFRRWTYRKQIKQTPVGHLITEFLPDVRWAGPYNSIVCPVGFHIREGRWLKDPEWVAAGDHGLLAERSRQGTGLQHVASPWGVGVLRIKAGL